MPKKTINSVLKTQIEQIKPSKQEVARVKKAGNEFIDHLKAEIKKSGHDIQVFVGGSFAKGTLIRKEKYDIDIFVRFDWRFDNISDMLEKLLKNVSKKLKLRLERLHGSRDYFQVFTKGEEYYFEVIPVTKIKKPREARNVTDLSYFHVPYVKRRLKGLEDELRLIKTFCNAQRVYGAETYVHGFSGYALELLVIHYKSFSKILRELSKVKLGERAVIDISKHYKKKNDIFLDMNESKLHSPVILVDPTFKERNALASLSNETFDLFKKAAKAFLKSPSEKFFVKQSVNAEALAKEAVKKKAEFITVRFKSDKQAGDIAGTKLKKFSEVLLRAVGTYFKVSKSAFEYDDKHTATLYVLAQSRKEVVRIGPPLHLKKFVREFKKEHMNTFEDNGLIHAKLKVNFGLREYVDVWKKESRKLLKDMSITSLNVTQPTK